MKGLKKLRRLFALLMAMIMVMGTCITTQAADTGSITITNAAVGETYSIYKLFKLTYNETTGSYKYTLASEWDNFFRTGAGADYVDISTFQSKLIWKDSADAGELAGIALAYAQDSSNGISVTASETATDTTLTFENLEYGYYLVDSTVGTLCSLTTANSNVKITDKNVTPTVEKVVEEDSTSNYGETNTAEIGDEVNFRTEIKNAYGQSNLVLHDEMSGGLTLDSSTIQISSGESLDKATTVDPAYYTIITDASSLNDECTFEVEFTDEFTATLTSSDIIYVAYTAEVNTNAVIGSDGNANEAYVEYGEAQTSTIDTTKTNVYNLYIYKYDSETEEPLEGAGFVLCEAGDDSRGFVILDNENKVSGWSWESTELTLFESGSNGLIEVVGLDAGDYELEEWKVPDGYAQMVGVICFTITETGELKVNNEIVENTVTVDDISYDAITIANSRGNRMPSTGGIGTTIFYVVGSIMALGAAVVLITRRRMHES